MRTLLKLNSVEQKSERKPNCYLCFDAGFGDSSARDREIVQVLESLGTNLPNAGEIPFQESEEILPDEATRIEECVSLLRVIIGTAQ
ncbi:MAG: hypothetical protein WBA18_12120 [Terracidiphilus sp.]